MVLTFPVVNWLNINTEDMSIQKQGFNTVEDAEFWIENNGKDTHVYTVLPQYEPPQRKLSWG